MTQPEPEAASPQLSIGELAQLAGVTTRAIRHYHAIGLLPEPARDRAGYRRYGPTDIVAAVRVARLRAVGMPIAQIAAHLPPGSVIEELPDALRSLAEDLDREITRLSQTRDRLRELAGSGTFAAPEGHLRDALREHGLLEPAGELAPGEGNAARLIDALHPGGLTGALDQARALLGDRSATAALTPLLQRFNVLAGSNNAVADALADEIAAVLPRPAEPAPPVDLKLMDKVFADRFNPAQRRCLHRLRAILLADGG
jgi:DNA-binding transcriptional MerR regulator